MTPIQGKRLAREARKLASECVEGRGPDLIAWHFELDGKRCVLGELAHRLGLSGHCAMYDFWWAGVWLESAVVALRANNDTHNAERRKEAVVFPLLALADEAAGLGNG